MCVCVCVCVRVRACSDQFGRCRVSYGHAGMCVGLVCVRVHVCACVRTSVGGRVADLASGCFSFDWDLRVEVLLVRG